MCSYAGFFNSEEKPSSVGSPTYEVFFSGELYNKDELLYDLRNSFTPDLNTASENDSTLIKMLFLEFGPGFVSKLNGVFSIAIIDHSTYQLYLYRDRIGAKPLFYYKTSLGIVFATEQNKILSFPGIKPELSFEGLTELLAIGPGHTSGNGIFKNLYEVLPGHYLTFSQYGKCDTRYWDLECRPHEDDYTETVLHVRDILIDAINRQTICDSPICSFLSGGLDSSVVTAIASNNLKLFGEQLNTYSFDFTGNEKYFKSNSFQPELDRPYVDMMVELLGTSHTYLECSNVNLFDNLFTAVDARDVPGMADVDSSILYFCKLVTTNHTVALTGECSDEVFGGYPWFYKDEFKGLNCFPWSRDFSAREALLNDTWIKRLSMRDYSIDKYKQTLSAVSFPDESADQAHSRKITYLNIKWFMQTLLDRMDRAGSYYGLTARVPFADHRLVEYVYNVPFEMKYHHNSEKALLRDAAKDLLPDQLLYRKKSPYPKTYNPGYEALLIEKFRAIMADSDSPILPLLDRKKTSTFLEAPTEYGRPWYGQLMAAPQLLAYYIQLDYWMRKYNLVLPY